MNLSNHEDCLCLSVSSRVPSEAPSQESDAEHDLLGRHRAARRVETLTPSDNIMFNIKRINLLKLTITTHQ